MRVLSVLILFVWSSVALAQERGAGALARLVDGLGVSARVLLVAAHPDDEDTALLAWLVHRQHADAAYLSLTRGDGGQNLIGDELGEALGVIRSEELLAARRLDGATQYFTRAYDFGFSKGADETYTHWPKDSVLRDVVTVMRAFRPHIVVAIFSGTPRDGHGHHQVSGILAREAFDAAADTVRFPRGVTAGHGAWTPSKLYLGPYQSRDRATVRFNVGEYDPILGRSYYEIAMESRSQHKSQAFGRLQRRGTQLDWLMLERTSAAVADNGATERSPFDGIDTTWARLRPAAARASREAAAALDSLPEAAREARGALDFRRPSTVVPALARVHRLLTRVRDARVADPDVDASVRSGLARVTRALVEAAGVAVEATAERDAVARGDSVRVDVTLYARGDIPVTVTNVRVEGPDVSSATLVGASVAVLPDSAGSWRGAVRGVRVTQPWWLAHGRRGDLFDVPRSEIAQPESERPTAAVARVTLTIDGAAVEATAPVVHRRADPVRGDVQRPLAVVPPIAVTLDRTVEYARAGVRLERVERVELRSAVTAPTDVTVTLDVPEGLTTDGPRRVSISAGGTQAVEFTVRGVPRATRGEVRAVAEARGERFRDGFVEIEYEHITPQRMYRDASVDVQGVEVAIAPGLRVAYVPGAGDNVAPMLRQLGIALTVIEPAAIATADLSPFSTVVVGTRAYESHPELMAHNGRLLDYARRGGTLVVQYGQYEMTRPGMMPYPISISRPHTRVTVEEAPVTFVEPDHSTLRTPNRIVSRDFDGWVQERALYMPSQFDSAYAAPLAMSDPGEPPARGALLVARYGQGLYIYTTMAFFRQLPAGVPGAARLFVNLLSARPSSTARTLP